MSKKHKNAFEQFNATFDQNSVAKWEQMVAAWDADITQPNPYKESTIGNISCYISDTHKMLIANFTDTTTADVQLELAREESADAQRGNSYLHETTVSHFLSQGLELEEQQ
jgi:hypothetical protein